MWYMSDLDAHGFLVGVAAPKSQIQTVHGFGASSASQSRLWRVYHQFRKELYITKAKRFVYHQAAGKYTLACDDIQPEGLMICRSFGDGWYTKPAAWIKKPRSEERGFLAGGGAPRSQIQTVHGFGAVGQEKSLEISVFLFYLFSLAVLMEAIRTRLISKQSFNNDVPISSVMYSDIVSNLSQYSVSAVSFNAMCILEIKSALLWP